MCVCVCVRARARVCAFMLYALNFDSMYLQRTYKRLGPVRVRHSKYSLLLLRGLIIMIMFAGVEDLSIGSSLTSCVVCSVV